MFISIFFFNDTATTEIYTLSLHDALPIFGGADLLRRAMGKKKPEVMAEQREHFVHGAVRNGYPEEQAAKILDRKSTRLNSSHLVISYAVFCLKKKNNTNDILIADDSNITE